MAAPAGVLQRSALVGIPLALVVLVFVTPGLLVAPGGWRVPAVWLKLPVVDEGAVNVTAMTEHGSTRFWYNATFEFAWAGPKLWVIRVTPEGDENSFDSTTQFTTDMQREENP